MYDFEDQYIDWLFEQEETYELIIRGKMWWYKLDKAVPNYDKTGTEWTCDVAIDDETMKGLKKNGVPANKFKNKGDERGFFLSFKRKTKNRDGGDAKPINVVGRDGKPWDMAKKLGNGSEVNVQFVLNENEFNGKKTVSLGLIGVQVVELVEYEGGDREEFPVYEDGTERWDTESE